VGNSSLLDRILSHDERDDEAAVQVHLLPMKPFFFFSFFDARVVSSSDNGNKNTRCACGEASPFFGSICGAVHLIAAI
jgi:hypothetical protein